MRRGAAIGLALLACAACVACAETRRSLGEECLKDDDCLSGYCTARSCTDHPPALKGALPATPVDASVPIQDARVDAPVDAPTDVQGGG